MSAFDAPGAAQERYDALASAPPANALSGSPGILDGLPTAIGMALPTIAARGVLNLEESVVTPARLGVAKLTGDQDYADQALDAQRQFRAHFLDNFMAPADAGWAAQNLIHGVAIPLAEYVGTGAATGTGALGGSLYSGLTAYNVAKIQYEAQGVKPEDAQVLAAGQGAVAGITGMAQFGGALKAGASVAENAVRMGIAQAGFNVATGSATRYATQQYLDAKGYAELAAQVHPFSAAEAATDAFLGFGLGYLHQRYLGHPVEPAKPGAAAPRDMRDFGERAPADVPASPTLDDAMAVNSVGHASVDLAPGPPADVDSMNAHADALAAADIALVQGDAVSVEATVEGAHFLDPAPQVQAEHAQTIEDVNHALHEMSQEQDGTRAADLGVEPAALPPVEKPIGVEDVRPDIGREAPAVPSVMAATKKAAKFAASMRGRLLRQIKQMGGINIEEAGDITGETTRLASVRMHPGLFRKQGQGIDGLVALLQREGYLTPEDVESVDGGADAARDVVRRALQGDLVKSGEAGIEHARLLDAAEQARDAEADQAAGVVHPERFWSDRPDKSLTVEGAHAALDRAARGEPLGTREQRFVDYAHAEAARREADRQELGAADRETQAERAAIMADNTPEELADVGYTDVPMRDQLEVAHLLSYADHLGELDDEANALRASDNAELPGTHEGPGTGTPGEDSGNGGGTSSAQEGARRYNAGIDDAAGNQRASATDEAIKQARRDPYTQDIFGRALPETASGGAAHGGTIPAGGVDVHAGPTVPAREVERGIFATFVKHVTTAIARLGLTHIKSAADAAHVFAYLRKMPQENLVLMTVDKDGKPLAISRHSIGGRASTPFELPAVMGSALRDPRAAAFYLAHNHPSGPTAEEFSEGDLRVHNLIRDAAQGGRVDYKGFFAIAGKRYLFTGAHQADVHAWSDRQGAERGDIPAAARTHAIPIEERRFTRTGKLGDKIKSPADAIEAARKIANGQEGVILLGSQHEPVGFLPVDIRSLQNMRGALADRFWAAIEATNAGAMLAVSQGTIQDVRFGALSNLAVFARNAGVRLIDAVTMGDQQNLGSAVSATSTLNFGEPLPKGAGPKAEPGAAHDLLTPYSNADILRREQEQQAQSKRDVESAAKAKAKAIADGQRDAFALTGSDRLADQSGQGGLFEPGAAGYGEYPGTLDDPVPRDVVLAADDARIAEAAKAPDVLGAAVQCFLTMGGP